MRLNRYRTQTTLFTLAAEPVPAIPGVRTIRMEAAAMNRAEDVTPLQSTLRLRLWGEFALLAMLVMEAFWITDWYSALIRPQAGWSTTSIFVGLVLILTHLLTRAIGQFHITDRLAPDSAGGLAGVGHPGGFPPGGIRSEKRFRIPPNVGSPGECFPGSEFQPDRILAYSGSAAGDLSCDPNCAPPLQVYLVQANFQLGLFLLLIYGLLFSWSDPTQALTDHLRLSLFRHRRDERRPDQHAERTARRATAAPAYPWLVGDPDRRQSRGRNSGPARMV